MDRNGGKEMKLYLVFWDLQLRLRRVTFRERVCGKKKERIQPGNPKGRGRDWKARVFAMAVAHLELESILATLSS